MPLGKYHPANYNSKFKIPELPQPCEEKIWKRGRCEEEVAAVSEGYGCAGGYGGADPSRDQY
jgi:hypothetical protein